MVDLSTPLQVSPIDLTIVVGVLGLALAASFMVIWATRRYLEEYARRTPTKIDDMIVSLLKGPVVFFIIAYGAILLVRVMAQGSPGQASSNLLDSLNLAYVFILVLVGTWTAAKLFVVVVHRHLQTRAMKTPTKVDDVAVGVFSKAGKILILIVGITIALGLLWMSIGLLRIASG